MDKDLQKKLFNEFPNLYEQAKLSPRESCMGRGICCGAGWFNIINDLSEKISKADPEVQAVQVKEKFGGLRFYIGGVKKETGDKIYDLINKAEDEAWKTCEKCGSKEDVDQTSGWIFTLCKKCRDEKKKNPDWRISDNT